MNVESYSPLTIANSDRWHTSWIEQFSILFVRAFKHRRGHLWTKIQVFQLLSIGILLGFIWFQIPAIEENLHDWIGANFFIQTYLGFAVMARGIVYFPQERAVVKKERHSGAYRLSAYFLSKICAESPVDMVLPFICCSIFYWMVGFSFDFPTYLWYIFTSCLGIAAANSFGIFLGCSIPNFSNALAMLAVSGLLMTALSGFMVKDRAMPVWIGWLKYLSLIRHSFLGSLLVLLSITAFDCAEYSEFEICDTNHIEYDGYIHMNTILESYKVEQKYWLSIVLLLSLVTFWYGSAYIFIRRTTQTNSLQ